MDNGVLAYRALLEKRKEKAPFWEKNVLTVEEAAEYTGIGRTKIRQIIMKGDCPFAVTNGVQVCVIRDKFIDYVHSIFFSFLQKPLYPKHGDFAAPAPDGAGCRACKNRQNRREKHA